METIKTIINAIEFIENYCCIKDKNTGEIKKIKLTKAQKHFINMQNKYNNKK